MAHNLKNQLRTLVYNAQSLGRSKHSDRANPEINAANRIYSCASTKNLLDDCNALAAHLRQNYGINRLEDVSETMVQAYIDEKAASWSSATLATKVSDYNKLGRLAGDAWAVSRPRSDENAPESILRVKAYDYPTFEKICDYASASPLRTHLFDAVNLCARTGARIDEAASVRGADIVLGGQNPHLHIANGKHGRVRDVPIRDGDLPYFEDLKNRTESESFACGGLGRETLGRDLLNAKNALGLQEEYFQCGFHGFRKMYARERYSEELNKGGSADASGSAWSAVCRDLGHGTAREDLFHVYIGQ